MWTKETEKEFFRWALSERNCRPEDLFYEVGGEHLFYLRKGVKGSGEVKQGRNALVGEFTETWAEEFLRPIVEDMGLYVVRGAIVPELGLVRQKKADIALCRTPEKHQRLENIVALVEVKMSIVWNWEWKPKTNEIICVGDFRTHQGRPSVLRRNNMLKLLGKVAIMRGMGFKHAVFVICNAPIPVSHHGQIDGYKQIGVIQGFFSVNPQPIDGQDEQINPKCSPFGGFIRWDNFEEAAETLYGLLI